MYPVTISFPLYGKCDNG